MKEASVYLFGTCTVYCLAGALLVVFQAVAFLLFFCIPSNFYFRFIFVLVILGFFS